MFYYKNIFENKSVYFLNKLSDLVNKKIKPNVILECFKNYDNIIDEIIDIISSKFGIIVKRFWICHCKDKQTIFNSEMKNFNIFIISFGWNLALKIKNLNNEKCDNIYMFNGDVLYVPKIISIPCQNSSQNSHSFYVYNSIRKDWKRIYILVFAETFIGKKIEKFLLSQPENKILLDIIKTNNIKI